ncbi:DUF3237 family protein [Paraburkholderia sp. 1N]|uniref:DUF3237 family protein n=1 Tax=Paraburkholderia solitsugae TaxID=2675748 RepID=A0ABX2BJM6_9BURK|nr:DUF3237 family protein [Paraburkholderia solitsugae]
MPAGLGYEAAGIVDALGTEVTGFAVGDKVNLITGAKPWFAPPTTQEIMSTPVFDELPAPLRSVQTRPLFVMRLDVRPIVVVGATPGPVRRVGIVPSGTFAGERLSGKILDGSSDSQPPVAYEPRRWITRQAETEKGYRQISPVTL